MHRFFCKFGQSEPDGPARPEFLPVKVGMAGPIWPNFCLVGNPIPSPLIKSINNLFQLLKILSLLFQLSSPISRFFLELIITPTATTTMAKNDQDSSSDSDIQFCPLPATATATATATAIAKRAPIATTVPSMAISILFPDQLLKNCQEQPLPPSRFRSYTSSRLLCQFVFCIIDDGSCVFCNGDSSCRSQFQISNL